MCTVSIATGRRPNRLGLPANGIHGTTECYNRTTPLQITLGVIAMENQDEQRLTRKRENGSSWMAAFLVHPYADVPYILIVV